MCAFFLVRSCKTNFNFDGDSCLFRNAWGHFFPNHVYCMRREAAETGEDARVSTAR